MSKIETPNPLGEGLFRFLEELKENNDRTWFQANKHRYEEDLKDPALEFISRFGPLLREISPHFLAIPRAQKGSLFRIYRDVRFSKDKRPYKTHAGIHFRHKRAKDAYAPGFYLHLDPAASFVGAGIWHPDSKALAKIRQVIAEDSAAWKRARDHRAFKARFELAGESLKRPPRGFDADHAFIEDLKRKDFIGTTELSRRQVLAPDFVDRFAETCRDAVPLVRFLCKALEVPF